MNLAIKLPEELIDKLNTFPLLHQLIKKIQMQLEESEEDDQLNVHLISHKKNIDILNLLPFKAYYHELDDDDLKNVFSIHRACVNLNLENVDTYISLTDSLVDASMGKYLRASTRIGLTNSKTKWFLTHKVNLLEGKHYADQRFELGKTLVEDLGEIPNVYSRNVDPMYADWRENPYLVLNLDLDGDEINSEWIDFFSLFTNFHFVITCTEADINSQGELILEFINKLPKKNDYRAFAYESNIDFAKLISFSQAFVTYDEDLLQVASYCGAYTFSLRPELLKANTEPLYSIGEVNKVSLDSSSRLSYDKVFDEIYAYLNSKLNFDKTEENL